ncbi:MAG: hypothetical protein H0T43_01900, partial [Solirubrobacterales bacterium]|nr:hypothetical protein [Solirubrobacterales bacterium]
MAAAAAAALLGCPGLAYAQDPVNTGPGGESTFGHVVGAPNVLLNELFATPFDPEDSDPAEAAAAAALNSPGDPESDLDLALATMAGSDSSPDQVAGAVQRALDILEGNPIAKKAYSGIALLNWNAPAKVKTVPGGNTEAQRTVVVNQVRWGEHTISDTWMLQFAAPTQSFRIRYRVVELGSAAGGQLNPTPLLNGAGAFGQHSAIQPLALDNMPTGTHQSSRFTIERGLGAVPEETRAAVQEVTVALPPANRVEAILDPNLRAGHESAATLMPATTERIASAQQAFGFSGATPTAAEKRAAIGRLAAGSPEKLLWDELDRVPARPADPAADPTGEAAFLSAARAVGAQNANLVGAMRSRTELPAGVPRDAGADATIVLQNNEAYLCRPSLEGACDTRRPLRLAAGAPVRVQVVNRDGFTHRMTAYDLHGRNRILGAEDWGRFDWTERTLADPAIPAGGSRTFTVTPADDAFALWLGDLGTGDQASAFIKLERGTKHEALQFGAGATPVHAAPDAGGNMWVTLAGTDTIARVRPTEALARSAVDRFPVPGGRTAIDDPRPPLAPADITVDGRGIVWATLASGNALLRINPALVQAGTSQGMKVIPLEACPTSIQRCRPEMPPVPNEGPTRRPTRIKSMIDGLGHTVLWFAEAGASGIGAMRVTEDGTKLNEAHFDCGCLAPESIDLGPDGSVWFTQIFENRIGRLRPDPTSPYSSSAVRLDHYDIPGAAQVADPVAPGGVVFTSLPLSIAVDGRNRVWFSESALSGIAWLDPATAVPSPASAPTCPQPRTGTCAAARTGFTEIEQPGSDFRSPSAPADVTVDRANNFWWAGEYGDQIEQVRPDGAKGLSFRGSVRRGLTEGPVADAQGNLWTVETGGNLITRISGVTEGPLRPFGTPSSYVANIAGDTVTGADLRDADTVVVRVVRGSAVVASATVPVAGGAFDVSGADWGTAADPVRADDTVRIQPRGRFERTELSFRVANLTAAVQGDGSVAGFATVPDPDRAGRKALADRIQIDLGDRKLSAPIDAGSGAWRAGSGIPQSAGGDVSWSGATVAGTFTTV